MNIEYSNGNFHIKDLSEKDLGLIRYYLPSVLEKQETTLRYYQNMMRATSTPSKVDSLKKLCKQLKDEITDLETLINHLESKTILCRK